MKILCIIPPHVPSYFNAGHHLGIFELAAYLRSEVEGVQVECVDGGALNLHWRRLCELLHGGFDLIAIMIDFDGIDPLRRFVRYARELTPQAKLLVFGRMTYQIPQFFESYDLDAIVESGDPETAVASYVQSLRTPSVEPCGVRLRVEDGFQSSLPGRWLPEGEWALPDVSEIPYGAYDRMYERDLDKFCGIPERRELVVPVARGCPLGCAFCDVPGREGKTDRRLPIDRVVSYITAAFAARPFEYVSFYAPTFSLRRDWVSDLCEGLSRMGSQIAWKCTTTLFHLDPELIGVMARSGCVRISVGLETLGESDASLLPSIKRNVASAFDTVANACNAENVELNCFVILGLPGDSPQGVAHTIDTVLAKGGRVRPTIYTPYQEMGAEMDEAAIGCYNRQLFVEGLVDDETAHRFYDLCYGNGADRPTRVMERIARSA